MWEVNRKVLETTKAVWSKYDRGWMWLANRGVVVANPYFLVRVECPTVGENAEYNVERSWGYDGLRRLSKQILSSAHDLLIMKTNDDQVVLQVKSPDGWFEVLLGPAQHDERDWRKLLPEEEPPIKLSLHLNSLETLVQLMKTYGVEYVTLWIKSPKEAIYYKIADRDDVDGVFMPVNGGSDWKQPDQWNGKVTEEEENVLEASEPVTQ